jgi:hypothetical protein
VSDQLTDEAIVSRLRANPSFRRSMQRRMHPGMVMVVSDLSLHPDRRSDTDFVIMSSA